MYGINFLPCNIHIKLNDCSKLIKNRGKLELGIDYAHFKYEYVEMFVNNYSRLCIVLLLFGSYLISNCVKIKNNYIHSFRFY